MKKVIYTGAFRFPYFDAASARVVNNIKLIKNLGYEVMVISWGGKDRELVSNPATEDIKYVVSHDLDTEDGIAGKIISSVFRGRNAIRYINAICDHEKIDTVIMYNPSAYFVYEMKRLSKRKRLHLISDLTEWYSPRDFWGWFMSAAFWANEINMRLLQRGIGKKIVISSFLYNYYRKSVNIIVPPLIDCGEAKWVKKVVEIPYFDGIRLIYAGHPENKDSLEMIIQSVSRCSLLGMRIQFLFLGVSKELLLRSKSKGWSSSFLNQDIFVFCGNVPQEDVPGYFAISDFSLVIRMSNRKTRAGFPTKLVESLMSGCPVIANSTSDIKKYIIDGYNGFLLGDSSQCAIEEMLQRIAGLSKADLRLMKNNSIRSAIENFDYKNYKMEMEALLKDENYK